MEWEKMNKKYAEEYFNELVEESQNPIAHYGAKYQDLRILIMKAYIESLKELEITSDELKDYKNVYKFDCIFAIKLYQIFLEEPYKIKEKIASNDGIWRYIQLCVVPEIIANRWGKENRDRFYKVSRRLYLKILWWYVYLSWNSSLEETKNIIMNDVNTSDTLAQLVERSGRNGYRIELYRTIMRKKTQNELNTLEFRKLMVLNSARVKVINPYLVNGGIKEYVENLIRDVRENEYEK